MRMNGKNRDTHDTVKSPLAIALNTSTYTTVLVADPDRFGYTITNDTSKEILVKEKAFDDPDALDRGFKVWGRTTYESPTTPVAIGEISCKAVSGTPSVLVTER